MKTPLLRILSLSAALALSAACGGSTSNEQPSAASHDASLDAANEATAPDAADEPTAQEAEAPEASPEAAPEVDADLSCVADFTAEIAPVIEGLLYMSESDRPFEVVSYPDTGTGEITPAHLLELLEMPSGTVVEQRTLDQFFTDYMLTGPDGVRYVQMRQILEKDMTDLTVIRVGTVEIHVYLVGRTACGEIAGLTTVAIET